ncbi:unnamed protein product, partial [Phaeothamnion confervicola]
MSASGGEVKEVLFGSGPLGIELEPAERRGRYAVGCRVAGFRRFPGTGSATVGPAEVSGAVRIGDIVAAVGGEPTAGLSFDVIMARLLRGAGDGGGQRRVAFLSPAPPPQAQMQNAVAMGGALAESGATAVIPTGTKASGSGGSGGGAGRSIGACEAVLGTGSRARSAESLDAVGGIASADGAQMADKGATELAPERLAPGGTAKLPRGPFPNDSASRLAASDDAATAGAETSPSSAAGPIGNFRGILKACSVPPPSPAAVTAGAIGAETAGITFEDGPSTMAQWGLAVSADTASNDGEHGGPGDDGGEHCDCLDTEDDNNSGGESESGRRRRRSRFDRAVYGGTYNDRDRDDGGSSGGGGGIENGVDSQVAALARRLRDERLRRVELEGVAVLQAEQIRMLQRQANRAAVLQDLLIDERHLSAALREETVRLETELDAAVAAAAAAATATNAAASSRAAVPMTDAGEALHAHQQKAQQTPRAGANAALALKRDRNSLYESGGTAAAADADVSGEKMRATAWGQADADAVDDSAMAGRGGASRESSWPLALTADAMAAAALGAPGPPSCGGGSTDTEYVAADVPWTPTGPAASSRGSAAVSTPATDPTAGTGAASALTAGRVAAAASAAGSGETSIGGITGSRGGAGINNVGIRAAEAGRIRAAADDKDATSNADTADSGGSNAAAVAAAMAEVATNLLAEKESWVEERAR